MAYYSTSAEYILNNASSHSAKQFADKIDIFYMNISAKENVEAVNIIQTASNEIFVELILDIPDHEDPNDFVQKTVPGLVSDALTSAALSHKQKVASPVPAFA